MVAEAVPVRGASLADTIAALRKKAAPYTSLDPEQGKQANFWADLGAGMLPVVGTAQAGRDFERSRREGDPLGMGLASLAAVPLVGKPVAVTAKALRKGAKAKKLAAQGEQARAVSFDAKNPDAPVLLGRSAEEEAALKAATEAELQAAALRKQQVGAPFPDLASRYPAPGAPTWELKNPKKPELGAYQAKGPSGESAAFMLERQAIQKQMDAEGFPRYYDPAQRVNADVSFYPTTERTLDAAKPKTAKTEQKWREAVQTPEAAARIEDAVKLADEVGGGDRWYWMGQLQQDYIKELGPEEGARRFKEDFADKMAATTGGADPGDNWLMAGYHNFMQGQGKAAPERAFEIPSPVGGRYVSGNMKLANKVVQGKPLTAAKQPKRFNFSRNFQGDEAPSTIDERMTELTTGTKQAAPAGDSYFAFEEMLSPPGADAANRGSRLQDRAWLGHKLREDLEAGVPRDKLQPGKPMVEWINESIHRTSQLTGLKPEDVVRGWVRRTVPVFGVAGTGVGTAALVSALRDKEQQTL